MWLVSYAHVPVSMCIAIASFDSSLREGALKTLNYEWISTVLQRFS